MTSQKTLKLYVYVDGVHDVPFYGSDAGEYEEFIVLNGEQFITSNGFVFNVRNVNEQIEIGNFRYDAKRMGGAPTISFTLMYEDCLDNFWSDGVYAVFNNEKYFLKQTPTSSLSNEDARYKHDVELVSERVALDNVYFFDAVVGNPQESDKPVSNSSKVVFFGDIREFASRLNASLEYSGLDYVVEVDNGITSEEKLMSFEDQVFSNVLQEIYNTYEVPYYFVGKTIHIGYANESVVPPTFAYGVDDALLAITKNNANFKVVNRATATGSSDNIPFYYPNNSPKGDVEAVESEGSQLGVKVVDYEVFTNKVEIGGVLTYQAQEATITKVTDSFGTQLSSGSSSSVSNFGYQGSTKKYKMYVSSSVSGNAHITLAPVINVQRFDDSNDTTGVSATGTTNIRIYLNGKQVGRAEVGSEGHTFEIPLQKQRSSVLDITLTFVPNYTNTANVFKGSVALSWATDTLVGWYYKDERVSLKDLGLTITNQSPYTGSTITQRLIRYIKPTQNLMPSIYRESNGDERFYNATNDTYEGVTFNNPYVEGRPKEHIFTVEDIKPTIKEAVNSLGLRMDMFSEFAYDLDDSDETVENENGEREFVHSYFFAKLRRLDFNLFDHAIENQPMTISFTSGDCGACNFEIGVTEEFPQKNPVQVNADGTLKRDSQGRVICGQFEEITEDECQPQQQDTINNEVWIALKKEETTYGILMPKAPKYDGGRSR